MKILQVDNPFPEGDSVMKGKFQLTTKTARTILSTTAEFYLERTTKDQEGKDEVEKTSLGTQTNKVGCPFELAVGETKEFDILIPNIDIGGLAAKMAKSGGMVGMLGKAAKLAGSLGAGNVKYYVEVTADVKGTPLDPSHKVEVRVNK